MTQAKEKGQDKKRIGRKRKRDTKEERKRERKSPPKNIEIFAQHSSTKTGGDIWWQKRTNYIVKMVYNYCGSFAANSMQQGRNNYAPA